jgi:hypothetical protein
MSEDYNITLFRVFADVRFELISIKSKVDKIVRDGEKSKDWGYIGDLNHILARLKELNHVDGSE